MVRVVVDLPRERNSPSCCADHRPAVCTQGAPDPCPFLRPKVGLNPTLPPAPSGYPRATTNDRTADERYGEFERSRQGGPTLPRGEGET